jgi:hypothetical protein
VDDADQLGNAPISDADSGSRVNLIRIDVSAFVADTSLVAERVEEVECARHDHTCPLNSRALWELLEEQRRALAEEIRRAERALDRYYAAFETGDLDAKRFQTRVSALERRLADLREQDLDLAARVATEPPTTPDTANLAAVANRLERVITDSDPKQAKALLRLLVKDLRVNGRREILPTYRVISDAVCALPSSVGAPGIEPGTSRV